MDIRVYVASKIARAEELKSLRANWKAIGLYLHARWLDQAAFEESASTEDFRIFWLVDEEDVCDSDVVIVYGCEKDELRGALVEAGMAIAKGILVITVGDSPSFGTWRHHPGVIQAGSLEHAKHLILQRFRIEN